MIAAATNTKALWYMTRGTGVVTLLLLTLSVVLGVTEVTRWASARFPRFVTAALHKNVSLLVMAFLGVHIVTAVADGFAPIRWLDVVIPFVSVYRPVWLGLGAVAFDLLVALIVTSLLRQRIGYRAWRAVHWASYACFPVALLHGLGTGTDTRVGWMLLLSLACLAAVVGALGWRIAVTRGVPVRARAWAGVASATLAVLIVGFTVLGPLAPGWARRAGTPASLLGRRSTASTRGLAGLAGAVRRVDFGHAQHVERPRSHDDHHRRDALAWSRRQRPRADRARGPGARRRRRRDATQQRHTRNCEPDRPVSGLGRCPEWHGSPHPSARRRRYADHALDASQRGCIVDRGDGHRIRAGRRGMK